MTARDAVERSVVLVRAGQGPVLGTGVLVSPTEVLTCAHVVEGLDGTTLDRLECVYQGNERDSRLVTAARPCPGSGHDSSAGLRRDVALLVLEQPFNATPAPLPWRDRHEMPFGRLLFAGHRQEGSLAGRLETVQTSGGDFDNVRGCYMLQEGCTRGFSGGPVVADTGDGRYVVGMVVANLRELPHRTWYIPHASVRAALAQIGDTDLPVERARHVPDDGELDLRRYERFLNGVRIKNGIDRSFIDLSASAVLPQPKHIHSARDWIRDLAGRTRDGQIRAFILGHYGSGKSSVAIDAAYRMVAESVDPRSGAGRLPVYIRLREWRRLPGWAELAQYLGQSSIYPFSSVEQVVRLAEDNHLFFLLDGLDEMSDGLSSRESLALVNGIPKSLPENASFVVFSRLSLFIERDLMREILDDGTRWPLPISLGGDLNEWHYEAVTLEAPSQDQIAAYLHDSCGPHAGNLTRLLAKMYNIADLVQRPVLLRMTVDCLPQLLQVRESGKAIEPADLYEMYVSRWLRSNQHVAHIALSQRLRVLERLAVILWHRAPPRMTLDELVGFVRTEKDLDPVQGVRIDEILLDIANSSLLDLGDTGYEFSHKSFLEYFVARAVAADLFDPGADGEKPKLISECLNSSRSFNEVMDFLQTMVVRRLGANLSGLETLLGAFESRFPSDRRAIGHLLGYVARETGDRILSSVLGAAYGSEDDISARRSLAIACGRSGRWDVLDEYVADVLPRPADRYENLRYHVEYYGGIRATMVALILHLSSPDYEFLRKLDIFTLRQLLAGEPPLTQADAAFVGVVLKEVRAESTDHEILEFMAFWGREYVTRITERGSTRD